MAWRRRRRRRSEQKSADDGATSVGPRVAGPHHVWLTPISLELAKVSIASYSGPARRSSGIPLASGPKPIHGTMAATPMR